MMEHKILFAGGAGVVGQQAVAFFRERHPKIKIVVGGRDLKKAEAVAHELGVAEAATVELNTRGLGLAHDPAISAIVVLAPDAGLNALAFAQERRIPYLSIGNWLTEIGGEMAYYIRNPSASPIVLASHWHGGPAVFLTIAASKRLSSVRSVKVGALVDPLDSIGPATVKDMEAGGELGSGALAFEGGRRAWLTGEGARRAFDAIDGRRLTGNAFAPYDIVSIQAATGAQDVRFDLATEVSSSRLKGGDVATELIVDVEGTVDGRQCRLISKMEFTRGLAALTGLNTALTLSTLIGLEEPKPAQPGLYFPESLMEEAWVLDQLRRAGARIETSEV